MYFISFQLLIDNSCSMKNKFKTLDVNLRYVILRFQLIYTRSAIVLFLSFYDMNFRIKAEILNFNLYME